MDDVIVLNPNEEDLSKMQANRVKRHANSKVDSKVSAQITLPTLKHLLISLV